MLVQRVRALARARARWACACERSLAAAGGVSLYGQPVVARSMVRARFVPMPEDGLASLHIAPATAGSKRITGKVA